MIIPGTTLVYAITIANAGPSVSQNVVLLDTLPACLLNAQYSFDGTVYNYWTGSINIGNLNPNTTTLVYIRGLIDDSCDEGVLYNTALVTSTTPDTVPSNNSSTVAIDIKNIKLDVIKSVDKEFVNIGDTLTYTIVITNNGYIAIDNVLFSDTIPLGTILVGTKSILNVNLGTIKPGDSKTITFVVKVISRICPPKLINKATITGSYILKTQRHIYMESNEVISYVDVKPFKQFSIDTLLKIPPQKPKAEDILEIISNLEIISTYLIKTPIITSYEGQVLTGWKVIVSGIIIEKVVYIADEPTQSVHAAEFEIPFCSFIILPKDHKYCKDIRIKGTIEDTCFNLDKDGRFISNTIILMIQSIVGC